MLKKIILGIIIGAVVFTTSAGFLYAYQKESGVKHNLDYKNSVISKNANNNGNNNQNYKNRLNNQDCQNCVNNNDCNTDCYQYRFSQTNRYTQRLQNKQLNQLNNQNNNANCNNYNRCYENQNCYSYRYNNQNQTQNNNCDDLNQQNMLRNRFQNNQINN